MPRAGKALCSAVTALFDPIAAWCQGTGFPVPVREYRFAPPRRFRFDWCWVEQKCALEKEGGIWLPGGGRHNRPAGYRRDITKYNLAALLGYRVFRATPDMISSGDIFQILEKALVK